MENIFEENVETDGKSMEMNTIKYVLQHKTTLRVRKQERLHTLLYISAREGKGRAGDGRATAGQVFFQARENVFPGRGEKKGEEYPCKRKLLETE